MAEYTTNYNLEKQQGSDYINIDGINDNFDTIDTELKNLDNNKVSKETGKGLSTNDFTNTEKTKLANIADSANNYTHPTSGVTAGSYQKVTVNAQGHVTAGENPTLPITEGGTGQTTAAGVRNALGLGNTAGALPIANGGTGATDTATARNNLGLGNTSGALPIANGGTSATTASAAIAALGAIPRVTRANYSTNVDTMVVGELMWKNYGNNHTIFDASASTTPSGGACSNTNPDVAWSASFPTLMGFNGNTTYGVRVDNARVADSASNMQYGTGDITAGSTALTSGSFYFVYE